MHALKIKNRAGLQDTDGRLNEVGIELENGVRWQDRGMRQAILSFDWSGPVGEGASDVLEATPKGTQLTVIQGDERNTVCMTPVDLLLP